MADTVTVKALEYHTYDGQEYHPGDTYEIAADLVDTIVSQRKAMPAVLSDEGPVQVQDMRSTGTTTR